MLTKKVLQIRNIFYLLIFWATIFFILVATPVIAQTPEEIKTLQLEVQALRKAQAAMTQDIQSIRTILNGLMRSTPRVSGAVSSGGAIMDLDDRPVRGEVSAPVTIVEFSDYQSTNSTIFSQNTFPEIDREFIKTGQANYLFKHLPDQSIHPQAFEAHQAAACAGDQDKYWEMNDLLFKNSTAQELQNLRSYASDLDLDLQLFNSCLASGKHAALIESDMVEAERSGVKVSPVFAIGITTPDRSSFKVMRVVVGAQPYNQFKEAIQNVLAAAR
jgi:protein-disulfide isomerase